MSKAFTKDDDAGEPPLVPRRAPLPAGVTNYVTASGLALLRAERIALEAERAGTTERLARGALDQRLAQLETRLASARVVDAREQPRDEVRFGATVTVADDDSEARWRIVGVDEADAARGRIAFVAPLARALLGKRVGDVVEVRRGGRVDELEVLAIDYADDAVPP